MVGRSEGLTAFVTCYDQGRGASSTANDSFLHLTCAWVAGASGLLFFNHRRGVSLLLSLTPPRHLQTHCSSSCACTCSSRPPCNIPHHRIQSRLSVQHQKTLQKLAAPTIAGDHNSRLELQRIDSTLDAGRPRGCRMALNLATSWASAPEPLQGTAMPPWRHVCPCPATQPDEIVAASI